VTELFVLAFWLFWTYLVVRILWQAFRERFL
jgi:hypothetical protein